MLIFTSTSDQRASGAIHFITDLKGQCPAKILNFCFPNLHIILPNATKYVTESDEKIQGSKTEHIVRG